jgi:membrane protease YdiL (CAAX protease family)
VAIPEEVLFRGIMQRQAERAWPASPWVVLLMVSLIFGLAHSNNPQPPYWTFSLGGGLHVRFAWAYVLLASLAGLAYGWIYRSSGRLMPAALVHATVDWTWWAFFKGP